MQDGRVHLPLIVDWSGERFGAPLDGVMGFGFHELVAHTASTRDLCAGTIVGLGIVSNDDYREIGSSCIAERRAIKVLDLSAPKTGFMRFSDTVRTEATLPDGSPLFGAIDQRVVASQSTAPAMRIEPKKPKKSLAKASMMIDFRVQGVGWTAVSKVS